MTRGMITQESMSTIERLAALCATPGINEDTLIIANRHIQDLLNGPIKMLVLELKTSSSGIVTLT